MRNFVIVLFILQAAAACKPHHAPDLSAALAHEKKIADSTRLSHEQVSKYLQISDSLLLKKRYDAALAFCDSALQLDDKTAIAFLKKGCILKSRKKFQDAINEYNSALRLNDALGQAWYERGLCYLKLKQKQSAVNDIKRAIEFHYPGADSVHEKINPLKKRIVGSHTLCCDGSTSNSTGRGTCSHHGGVCGTEYEYETYRDY